MAALFERGCQRAAEGDWSGAALDFARELEDAPSVDRTSAPDAKLRRIRALDCLGLASAANDDYNSAVKLLTEALLIEPSSKRFCLLARIHCCERQWQLAEDRYKDALLIDPDCRMAQVGLAQATIKHEPMPLLASL